MALVLFGIGLVGLCPLVVMHSRALETIDRPLAPGVQYYLVRPADTWRRRLGASATIAAVAPADPPPPPCLLVNDGDASYSESGSGWASQTDTASFHGGYRQYATTDPLAPAETASWSFAGIPSGWYQVQATWLAGPDRATNARYTVLDAADPLGSFTVDQRSPPSDAVTEVPPWQTLATLYFASGTARVDLSSQGNGLVIADAVRLAPLRAAVEILLLDRSADNETLTARVRVHPAGP